jgi:outer membrane protein OmpA-like peptidoglycan-associated protein
MSRRSLLAGLPAKPARPFWFAPGSTSLFLCSVALLLGSVPAPAEELTVEQMVCALDPQCTKPFEDVRLRGITATPSMHTPGSFDRTVNFAFNSAELTADARKELDAVAEALNSPNLGKLDIVIAGHTDAVGNDDYNQVLSQRRAEAARNYLITQHRIDGKRLAAKGYGKSQLLLSADPTNELNRRVQFINPNYAVSSAPGAAAPTPRPATSSDGL